MRTSWRLAFIGGTVALGACSSESPSRSRAPVSPPSASQSEGDGRSATPLFTFEGAVDLRAHTMTVTRRTPAGDVVIQATLPYGTAPGNVYFHTCGTPTYGSHTLSGQVQAVNLMAGTVTGFNAVIDSVSISGITPSSGVIASYGSVAPNTGNCASTQTWAFTNPTDANFSFVGHAEGLAPVTSCATRASCRVFVSSTKYNGNLGGLAGADAKCQALAAAAGVSGTYKAFLSDSTTNAKDRLVKASVPYKLVDGTTIAPSFAYFGSGAQLPANVDKTESGGTAEPYAWTWSAGDGTKLGESPGLEAYTAPEFNCADWTSATSYDGVVGTSQTTANSAQGWASSGYGTCSDPFALYCFEQ